VSKEIIRTLLADLLEHGHRFGIVATVTRQNQAQHGNA